MAIREARCCATVRFMLKNGIQIGEFAEKTKIEEKLPAGRKLATLSQAASIKDDNCYWICAYSRELEPRPVNGSGYLGRTFDGVPAEEGHYLINSDNTFTKLKEKGEADWSQRLYVSSPAASEAARGKGSVVLYVMRNMSVSSRLGNALTVFTSYDELSNIALVASVPESAGKISSIASEVMRK